MNNQDKQTVYEMTQEVLASEYNAIAEDKSQEEITFIEKLNQIISSITSMLIEKNRKYGNSALEPIRVFSKASPQEQILVRIDDKLSRFKNQAIDEDEDVVNDLIGYLILLKMVK